MALWDGPLQLKLHRLYRESASTARSAAARRRYHANIEYFDQIILRSLKPLEMGREMRGPLQLAASAAVYPPKKLVLCVRDLRAVDDLGPGTRQRMGLVSQYQAHAREAWIFPASPTAYRNDGDARGATSGAAL